MKTLVLYQIKQSWKMTTFIALILCAYQAVIISLVNPQDMASIQSLFGVMGGFLDAFGISVESMTSPLAYTASTFFSSLVQIFSMLFYMIAVYIQIARPIQDTSLAYTLSSPVSRKQWLNSHFIALTIELVCLFGLIFVSGSLMLWWKGSFAWQRYALLVFVTWLLVLMMGFLTSFLCVIATGHMGLTIGIPLVFLIASMLCQAGGEKLNWLVKLTPFGWLDSVKIVNGDQSVLFIGIGLVLLCGLWLGLSQFIFKKKNLIL